MPRDENVVTELLRCALLPLVPMAPSGKTMLTKVVAENSAIRFFPLTRMVPWSLLSNSFLLDSISRFSSSWAKSSPSSPGVSTALNSASR